MEKTAPAIIPLQGIRLSPWITVHDFCATRVIEGTDPADIGNRIAFIEKTPRVLMEGKWVYEPKAAAGPTEPTRLKAVTASIQAAGNGQTTLFASKEPSSADDAPHYNER